MKMCTEETFESNASNTDSRLQLPQELKDTWHEVIVRSFQLLSSISGGNDKPPCFNRQQLLSPVLVLWDKFRFDRKFITSWKQQFVEALNEEVVVRKVATSSSNTEMYMLRNFSEIPVSKARVTGTQYSQDSNVTESAEEGPERAQDANDLTILKKRSRSTLEEAPIQEDYTYEEVIDLLPPVYKKPLTEKVTLSCTTIAKAPLLHLEQDGVTVRGEKGYRSIRASHGVLEGDWYFEVEVLQGDGNVRIGWCTVQADMEAPIGYDKYGYSIRDKTGELFHEQRLIPFGEAFGEGDTIGCFLHLPPVKDNMREVWETFERKWIAWLLYYSSPRRPNWHQQETWRPKEPQVEGKDMGYMEFFKNGRLMGSQEIEIAKWYPAIALYKNAKISCNFGPHFQYPNMGREYRPMSSVISHT
ncbi:hypothetical protein Gasu_13310 isoform 1 [Galdieria sulphuraria]|uniref:B30.2/SPRY domain-containing protein n=1 Tax=Galdieria sulphuraria TaxID=130081 RepID=M2XMH7_GALSU|nr:hypothetical protein Gasu_13310 isoform 1 [Galdieria sulphuraria]EME31367.1 hypothetical protein isoform 1 [Galdieria sulphuraria]|eukprot:XP_005707887.1 hypothetical protein isoform 1 [Galdieria sulphuraria]